MKKLLLGSIPLGMFLVAAGPSPPPNIVGTAPITVSPSGSSFAQRTIACPTCGTGTGNVTGTGPTVSGHLAVFNNTSATGIADGGAQNWTAAAVSSIDASLSIVANKLEISPITSGRVLGYFGGGTGIPAAATPATVLQAVCSSTGQIYIVAPGSAAGCLSAGSVGKFLQQQQPSGNNQPVWASVPYHESYKWDSNTSVVAGTFPLLDTTATGTINSVTYHTGGTTPSFTLAIQIDGVNVTSCNALTVSSATPTTTTCTGANTYTAGHKITAVVSGPSGTINTALVQINYQEP
jgi:hypothetical protein